MKHIEYEERVLISESDYKKVIEDVKKEGKPLTYLHIENIYLDDSNSYIRKTKKMLRIRRTNNTCEELTLKMKDADGSTIEINETLERHPIIDKELDNKFEEFHEVIRLTTERIEVQYPNYLFVIDKNMYCGITDYDLEVEADNQANAKKIIEFYCEKYKLQYDPKYKTKSHRAFNAMKEKRENSN